VRFNLTNTAPASQLLAGLFKVCDIKVSGAQLKELAAIIGTGMKHISHHSR